MNFCGICGLVFGFLFTFFCGISSADTLAATSSAERPAWLYPQTEVFRRRLEKIAARGISFTDYHIHTRGGMTPEKALHREADSGIRSAVLENEGREWPLNDNAALAAHIAAARRAAASAGKALPVGIQVNDRDWYKRLDPKLLRQLDYVLADTMIMGETAEGKPQRLWLPSLKIPDADAWMEAYMRHNLRILDEPISILANPTYLPDGIAAQYDRLWTPARMKTLIEKAVRNNVALEIQAGSPFPKPAFIRLARQMGAKFSFGTNNFDDKARDLSKWFDAIDAADIGPADIAVVKLNFR
ncbi:MAG: hypothetical protein LBV54_01840 [Puniceicoccales bacterium]|nr:hypothetical protein [Puniceicoccales bacterium]